MVREAVFLFLIASLGAGITAAIHPRAPSFIQSSAWELTPQEARGKGEAVLWVDARSETEYRAGHLPGAILLNEEDWSEQLPHLLQQWEPEKVIVVYCSSRACGSSRQVAERLRKETGLEKVFVLKGGWEAWRSGKN